MTPFAGNTQRGARINYESIPMKRIIQVVTLALLLPVCVQDGTAGDRVTTAAGSAPRLFPVPQRSVASAGERSTAASEAERPLVSSYRGMKITEALSELTLGLPTDEITDSALHAAKKAVLDALGCAMAGHKAPGVETVVNQTTRWGGQEEATLWFHGGKVPAPKATFANSVQTHALDLDDVHLPSVTHITSVIVPAAFAAGEATDASGKDTLAAVIMGIEVSGRLGRAYSSRRAHGGFLPTSMVGGFGASAAAGRLLGLSSEETTHAMGISYAHCSGNRQALLDRTLTKRIQPGIAARGGVFSAYLAQRGMTGPNRVIGKQPAALLSIYGTRKGRHIASMEEIMEPRGYYEVEQISYKRFACCGASHPLLEGVLHRAAEYDLQRADIAEIQVFGVRGGLVGTPWRDAENPHVLAQFCVPYQVASLIKNRRFGAAEITPERIADDHDVDAMARSVAFADWEHWDGPVKPQRRAQGVRLELTDGRALHAVRYRDDALRPDLMPWEKIVEKFKTNAVFSGLVDEAEAEAMVRAIENLDQCESIREFVDRYLISATDGRKQ